jgi:hypothetical protein
MGAKTMSIEAMKQALEALEWEIAFTPYPGYWLKKAITSLRQALSEAQLSVNENSHAISEAENPKGYKITGKLGDICSFVGGNEVKKGDMVYLKPQREWVGLTDAEIEEFDYYARDLVMDIEKALKERNNVA